MPRRGTAASGLTIGFIGSGQIDTEAAENLLIDYIDSNTDEADEIQFIVPITEEGFSQTLGDVCSFARENEIPYTAVINVSGSMAPKSIKAYVDNAAKSHKVVEVEEQVVKLLAAAPGACLFILFDATDEEYNSDLSSLGIDAHDAGIKVYDYTDALAAIQPDDSEAEAEKPARRSRAKADHVEEAPEPASSEGTDIDALTEVLTKAVIAALEEFFSGEEDKPEPEKPARASRRQPTPATEEPEEATPTPRRRRATAAPEAEPEADAPRRSRGRPRKDGTPAQPRTPAEPAATSRLLRRG